MAVENIEDARKYLDQVEWHLDKLTSLSLDAGMGSHASMWLSIHGAFVESMDEVKTITDMVGMFLENRMKRGF